MSQRTRALFAIDSLKFYYLVLSFLLSLLHHAAPLLPANCEKDPQKRNEGATVVLRHCNITSPVQLSEFNFQWSKRKQNGEVVEIETGTVKYSINNEGSLTISNAQPSDSGLYQVNISNEQGSALHTVHLEVVDIPEITETPNGM